MIWAKSLTKGDKVATIKVEGFSNPTFTTDENSHSVEALYALLGGYNEVARHVNVDEFHAIQKRFRDCIQEMAEKIAA